jgi:hypothetical protein
MRNFTLAVLGLNLVLALMILGSVVRNQTCTMSQGQYETLALRAVLAVSTRQVDPAEQDAVRWLKHVELKHAVVEAFQEFRDGVRLLDRRPLADR